MNKKLIIAIASMTVTGALTAGPAMAATKATTEATTKATAKETTKETTARRRVTSGTRDWETTAGTFRTETAARTRVERLRTHGMPGFVIEREQGNRRLGLEVEKPTTTRATAEREAALVRRHGFRAGVERS